MGDHVIELLFRVLHDMLSFFHHVISPISVPE
jgi:hypothetical protein